jgi:membrane protein
VTHRLAWRRLRRRVGWLDHLVRAGVRYDQADGGRLAAAVTYYSFFAVFSLGLLAFAVFGFVLDDPAVQRPVERYVAENLPHVDVQTLLNARNTAGVIAFVGLPVTGWFWADVLRSSIRRIWRLPEYPGRLVTRVLIDLLVLTGLGVLLAASVSVAYLTTAVAGRLVDVTHTDATVSRWLLATVGLLLGVGVNMVVAAGMLTGLPRVRIPVRRLWRPALLVAVGLELLKTLGALYVRRTEANPAYHLVAASVGLLVFINAVNQLVLFAAALTATGTGDRRAGLTAEDVKAFRRLAEPSLSTCDAVRSDGEDRASLVERQSQTPRAARCVHPQ